MSEPNSSSDQIPPVPPAPSFTYGSDQQPPAPEAPAAPAAPGADTPLPPPAYGERIPGYQPPPAAPAAPGYAQQPYGVPGYAGPGYAAAGYGAPAGPKRRTWDLVLTVILFVMGLFGMIIGLFYAAILADPYLFGDAMAQQGMPISVDTRGAALIIGVSHPVLYLVAVGVGILLLVKRKIAFWAPLTAGVLATLIFWITLMSVLLSDPAVLNFVR